jgi:hypothetical protein
LTSTAGCAKLFIELPYTLEDITKTAAQQTLREPCGILTVQNHFKPLGSEIATKMAAAPKNGGAGALQVFEIISNLNQLLTNGGQNAKGMERIYSDGQTAEREIPQAAQAVRLEHGRFRLDSVFKADPPNRGKGDTGDRPQAPCWR